jgi:hypothetical protein
MERRFADVDTDRRDMHAMILLRPSAKNATEGGGPSH